MPYKNEEEWERRKWALRSDEDFYAAEAEATKDVFDIRHGLVRPGRECRVCGENEASQMRPRKGGLDGVDTICLPCYREWQRGYNAGYRAKNTARTFEQMMADRWRIHRNGMKKCSKCQTSRPFDDFGIGWAFPDGLYPLCRLCTNDGREPRGNGPGFVYRLFNREGVLLYVGRTVSLRGRFYVWPQAHSTTKPWWDEVSHVEVAEYATHEEVCTAEALAIEEGAPLHNLCKGTRFDVSPSATREFTTTPEEVRAGRPVLADSSSINQHP